MRQSVYRRAHAQRPGPDMPVRSYFLFAGGALLTLLFAANWLLPSPPPHAHVGSDPNLANIRIHSELKGPDAVVIDTTKPIMMAAPAPQMDIAGPQAAGMASPPAEDAGAPPDAAHRTLVSPELGASFAQLVPTPPKRAGWSEPKRPRRISP